MPTNPVYHAMKGCFSPGCDVTATWTAELLAYLKKYHVWYALKHETGERPGCPGKLHIHWVQVSEIIDSNTTPQKGFGPLSCDNRANSMLRSCPEIQKYKNTKGCAATFKCHKLESTEFINEYMQKEGDCKYAHLPQDQMELIPYFADKKKVEVASKDFELWKNQFFSSYSQYDINNPSNVLYEDVETFLHESMYIHKSMRVVTKVLTYNERHNSLYKYITGNREIPTKKRKLQHVHLLPGGAVNPFVSPSESSGSTYKPPRKCKTCDNAVYKNNLYCDHCKNY